tara:strand:- start:1122 stop:2093 length:972 start_codon:yes stop_codon:yes gene_type:complete
VKSIIRFFGIDPEQLVVQTERLWLFVMTIVLSLALSFYGFYYAMFETTGIFGMSLAIGLFFSLLVLNLYRLFFSLISIKYRPSPSFMVMAIYVVKRGYILVIIAAFVSKTVETQLLAPALNSHISNWKSELLSNYQNALDINTESEKEQAFAEYSNSIEDDILFDRDSESSKEKYKIVRDNKLQQINKKLTIRNRAMTAQISNSSFFITKLRFLSERLLGSWLITICIVVLFLYPVYMYLFDPMFLDYARSCDDLHNKRIISEHKSFVDKYNVIIKGSTNKDLRWEDQYVDPPFNTIMKPRGYEILKNGSFVSWLDKFGKSND